MGDVVSIFAYRDAFQQVDVAIAELRNANDRAIARLHSEAELRRQRLEQYIQSIERDALDLRRPSDSEPAA